jgi:hypothetical protein
LQILWDESKKAWVNKDDDGTEVESFKPPPKMGDLMGSSQQQQIPQQQQMLTNPSNYAVNPQMQTNESVNQMAQQQQLQQQQQQPILTQNPQMMNQTQQQSSVTQVPLQAPGMVQQQQHQQQPTGSADQPSIPSAPNMFKMQKGRSMLIFNLKFMTIFN